MGVCADLEDGRLEQPVDWRPEPEMAGSVRERCERDDGDGGNTECDELRGVRWQRPAQLPGLDPGAHRRNGGQRFDDGAVQRDHSSGNVFGWDRIALHGEIAAYDG